MSILMLVFGHPNCLKYWVISMFFSSAASGWELLVLETTATRSAASTMMRKHLPLYWKPSITIVSLNARSGWLLATGLGLAFSRMAQWLHFSARARDRVTSSLYLVCVRNLHNFSLEQ